MLELCKSLMHNIIIEVGAGEGNRTLSENVHNSLNCPIIVHCKPHIFQHVRIKRHGDDQTLMQIDASANVISRPCALVRSYHNPANWRVKLAGLSIPQHFVVSSFENYQPLHNLKSRTSEMTCPANGSFVRSPADEDIPVRLCCESSLISSAEQPNDESPTRPRCCAKAFRFHREK